MSRLLKEIKRSKPEAVSALEEAGFRTDSEIQSLTREDLHELFPGLKKLKLRKTLLEIIHKQKPTDALLRELKDFIPHDSLRDALNSNGVLVDYLHILKEMKTQTENVQNFLEAHIGLLEEFTKNQHQEPDKGTNISKAHNQTTVHTGQPNSPGAQGYSAGSDQLMPYTGQRNPQGTQGFFSVAKDTYHKVLSLTESRPQGAQGTDISGGHDQMLSYTDPPHSPGAQDFPRVSIVMYQKVVSGKTFGADEQLLAKVKAQDPDRVQLVESDQDNSKIIIVFCTISSRVGSDVEAAMCDVKGDKPVILVLLHHTREPKNTLPTRTSPDYRKVELQVNVFFHETTTGLLKCKQNDEAAIKIQKKLLDYSVVGSGNAGTGGNTGSWWWLRR